ncbi:MAG: putative sulfate exporter family transporter [Planctomycetota bacterium]|nr:putative sulfate exporter family transporter [Planctomycetota bacterium]
MSSAQATQAAPMWKVAVFVLLAAASALPWASPAIALAVGIAVGLAGLSVFGALSKKVSKQLIQWCVATLGLTVPLGQLWSIAREGLVFSALTMILVFGLGALLARLLRTGRDESILICAGTAVCGGSAIAATGSAIGAASASMAIATGAVFILNAASLYILPPIAHALHLSDVQFGTWAGIAIHDVASVTGAAKGYVAEGGVPGQALETATVVKLARVLWIVPIALIAGWWVRRQRAGEGASAGISGGVQVPWIVVLFVLACVLSALVPAVREHTKEIRFGAGLGFQLALFLIGAGITRAAMKAVGWRVLVQALVLWLALAGASLAAAKLTIS